MRGGSSRSAARLHVFLVPECAAAPGAAGLARCRQRRRLAAALGCQAVTPSRSGSTANPLRQHTSVVQPPVVAFPTARLRLRRSA